MQDGRRMQCGLVIYWGCRPRPSAKYQLPPGWDHPGLRQSPNHYPLSLMPLCLISRPLRLGPSADSPTDSSPRPHASAQSNDTRKPSICADLDQMHP